MCFSQAPERNIYKYLTKLFQDLVKTCARSHKSHINLIRYFVKNVSLTKHCLNVFNILDRFQNNTQTRIGVFHCRFSIKLKRPRSICIR
uniref:Uncharacterized protein n=1 Tax=Stegastes partitus TaxID=144197 RepID=A0A3B5AF57_9TELE